MNKNTVRIKAPTEDYTLTFAPNLIRAIRDKMIDYTSKTPHGHTPTHIMMWYPAKRILEYQMIESQIGYPSLEQVMGLKLVTIGFDDVWGMEKPIRDILQKDGFFLIKMEM